MTWWMFGDNSAPHNSMLSMAGDMPRNLVALRGLAAVGVQPSSAPQGWLAGNVPVTGDWIDSKRIPAKAISSKASQLTSLDQMGPYNAEMQQANALQAALAQSLKELR